MQHITFWLGIALVVIGCFMLAHTNAHAGSNEIRILGMIFKVSHPALVIIVLGFLLVILNDHGNDSFNIPEVLLEPEMPVAPETTVPEPPEPLAPDTTATNVAPAAPGADAAVPPASPAGQVEPLAAQDPSMARPDSHLPTPETNTPASEITSPAAADAAAAAAAAAAADAAAATELEAAIAESTDPAPATLPSRQSR